MNIDLIQNQFQIIIRLINGPNLLNEQITNTSDRFIPLFKSTLSMCSESAGLQDILCNHIKIVNNVFRQNEFENVLEMTKPP